MAISSPTVSTPPTAQVTSPNSLTKSGSLIFADLSPPKLFYDATSVRSLASIGMGSTDGRKMVIRRVPNSPTELLNIVTPTT